MLKLGQPWKTDLRDLYILSCLGPGIMIFGILLRYLKSVTKSANLFGCGQITGQRYADFHSGIIKVPLAWHFLKCSTA